MRTKQSRAEQSRAEQSRAEQSRAEQSRAEQSRAEQYTAMQCNGHSALKAARWLRIARAPAYHYGGQLFGTCSKREVVFCTSNQICEMLPAHQRTERLLHQVTPTNISFSAGCMFMRGDITVGKTQMCTHGNASSILCSAEAAKPHKCMDSVVTRIAVLQHDDCARKVPSQLLHFLTCVLREIVAARPELCRGGKNLVRSYPMCRWACNEPASACALHVRRFKTRMAG